MVKWSSNLKTIFHNGPVAKLLLIAWLSLSLLSCESSDSAESIFSNYLWRLSNSLEVDLDHAEPVFALPRYPTRRQLYYAIPSININLLEFLKLSRCDLQRHIGQRNSVLGQVMKDSQTLLYNREFIRLAQDCLEHYASSNPLYSSLQQAIKHKQDHLPELYWNATFASEEFQQMFSLGAKPLRYSTLSQTPVELINALQTLTGFTKMLPVEQSFEQALGVVSASKYMGALRLSMHTVQHELKRADQLLGKRIEGSPLCLAKKGNAQFDIVNKVFQKFYIGEVQPYIAKLYQQSEQLFAAIDNIAKTQKMTVHFQLFWQTVYRSENSEWQQFQQSIKQHTQHWQQLLKQCGRLPTYTRCLSTSGGVGCTRSPQSHSGPILLGLRAFAAYPEVEI